MGTIASCCMETEKVKDLENENNYLRQKLNKATQSTSKLTQQQTTHSQKLQQYEHQIQLLKENLESARQQNVELKNKEPLSSTNKQMEVKHLELQKTVQNLNQKLKELKEKASFRQKELNERLDTMQSELAGYQQEKKKIEDEMTNMKESNFKKETQLMKEVKWSDEQKESLKKELTLKSQAFEEKLQAKDNSIKELKEALQQMEKERFQKPPEEQASKREDLEHQLQKTLTQLGELKECQKKSNQQTEGGITFHFFNASLLSEQNELKAFMVRSIEERFQKKIVKTRLLYLFDEFNKVNIHRYIDYKYGLAAVIKLSNGRFIGIFSEGPFYPKMESKYGAMILSLSDGKVFKPLPNCQAIVYDDQAVVFGNSDIKIKTGEKKVFSNFGTPNSHYDSAGQKVDILLGEGHSRQTAIHGYEFYEVVFSS